MQARPMAFCEFLLKSGPFRKRKLVVGIGVYLDLSVDIVCLEVRF